MFKYFLYSLVVLDGEDYGCFHHINKNRQQYSRVYYPKSKDKQTIFLIVLKFYSFIPISLLPKVSFNDSFYGRVDRGRENYIGLQPYNHTHACIRICIILHLHSKPPFICIPWNMRKVFYLVSLMFYEM